MSYKTVICCVNSKYIHSSLAPWYLYAGVKKYCKENVNAVVCEGTINENVSDVAERIIAEKADAVGFCCYIWNISFVLKIAKLLKESQPNIKIVLGGPEVSFNGKQVLEDNSFVDFIISGEGEEAFARLINTLADSEKIEDGLVSRRTKNGIEQGIYHICKEEISPYCEEYFNSLGNRIAYIESSRGCPYHCAFCLSGEDRSVRFFELERVKEEMLALCGAGAKTIKFVDRTFNCNSKRAKDILHFIKDNYGKAIGDDVCFHFEIAADILNEELLGLISQMPTGSVQFEAGIQSFNEKTLEYINRKTDLKKLTENIVKLVSFKNCHVHIDLIAGLAYEDLSSFRNSFNKAYVLGANMLQLGFLKILYGSCMQTQREKYPCEYRKEPPYEVISTPWISEAELTELHKTEDALEKLYNSGRFKRTLNYIMSVYGEDPFEVFDSFGRFVFSKGVSQPPLDLYTDWIYEYFSACKGVSKTVLRDCMITDRLATNSSDIIPSCLRIEDRNLKAVKRYINEKYPKKSGVRRSVAILYTFGEVIFCDYDKKDRVSGEYPINKTILGKL